MTYVWNLKGEIPVISKPFSLVAVVAVGLLGLTACSGTQTGTDAGGSAGPTDTTGETQSAKILMNWFAQAEQGGYWAAQAEGLAAEHGVDLSLQQGGTGTKTIPEVAAGSADFGVANEDEIILAVENGLPIVAVMTGFDQSIQELAYHEGTGISDFSDLNGHKVAVSADPYWQFIKNKYDLDDVHEVNVGSLANFQADKDLVQQVYITAEPFTIEQMGVDDVAYLPVADSGYNRYENMLFTTQEFIQNHPDVVQAVVDSSREGWQAMLDDPTKTKQLLLDVNSDMDPDQVDYSIEQMQKTQALLGQNIGNMVDERWSELKDQLAEVGLVDADFDVTKAYTLDFVDG